MRAASVGREVTIHDTAIVEDGVQIGDAVVIWDAVHIRSGAALGSRISVGEKTYIAYDVRIGDDVKINAHVYICAGVVVEEMCMISAGVVFTNDMYPRAMNQGLTALETSAPTEDTLRTHVARGATIGANATVGPGLTLGEFSMVGMGSVVTRDVPAFALAVGAPAKVVGYVCACGPRLWEGDAPPNSDSKPTCARCGRAYRWSRGALVPEEAL